jgi:hypothetical protein
MLQKMEDLRKQELEEAMREDEVERRGLLMMKPEDLVKVANVDADLQDATDEKLVAVVSDTRVRLAEEMLKKQTADAQGAGGQGDEEGNALISFLKSVHDAATGHKTTRETLRRTQSLAQSWWVVLLCMRASVSFSVCIPQTQSC